MALLKDHPLVDQIDKTECAIRLKGDRPDILCLGLNDGFGDRVRGLRIYKAALDEYQAITQGILDEVIMPAMADTVGSKALITGTPKGKLNGLYMAAQRHLTLEDWAYLHFATADNPFIPRDELTRAELTLDPRIYRQEYLATFEDSPGRVYTELDEFKHLVSQRPEFVTTYLGVDWGDLNPALVVVGMTEFGRYYIVETWQNTTGLPVVSKEFYAEAARLCRKWAVRRTFCDPSRPAAIAELRRVGTHEELPGLQRAIRAFNRISEGCQVVNNLLHCDRLFVHESERGFFEELQSYHRSVDEAGNVLEEIEDGQVDHRTDALRYLLATLEIKHDLSANLEKN